MRHTMQQNRRHPMLADEYLPSIVECVDDYGNVIDLWHFSADCNLDPLYAASWHYWGAPDETDITFH